MLASLRLTLRCKFEVTYFLLLRRAYNFYDDLDTRRLARYRDRNINRFDAW